MFDMSNIDYCMLMIHQKKSMSMYRKFKIEHSLARNMFRRLNMDSCLVGKTSEEVNEYL
jgi:hypothetical protein